MCAGSCMCRAQATPLSKLQKGVGTVLIWDFCVARTGGGGSSSAQCPDSLELHHLDTLTTHSPALFPRALARLSHCLDTIDADLVRCILIMSNHSSSVLDHCQIARRAIVT